MIVETQNYLSLKELCMELSISVATGQNWIKLGKIKPDFIHEKRAFFTTDYVMGLKNSIITGDVKALKSRRNKKYVSGNSFYNSYISESCDAVLQLQKVFALIDENEIVVDDDIIRILVADAALHLFASKEHLSFEADKNLLQKFLRKEISIGKFDPFISNLISDRDITLKFCSDYSILFGLKYEYEANEDILGLIYISCKNIGKRKATGSYFTPTKVVKKLIRHLPVEKESRILDPCCGTGNFLMQLPGKISAENIYGSDIDEISVLIARVNMALKFPDTDPDIICEHISLRNYLTTDSEEKYDFIIGNPPWGFEFDDAEADEFRHKFVAATGKSIESYDIFIEQALGQLSPYGRLAFVLPEALLNVKSHMPIRHLIIENNSILSLDFLGNAFDGVQCPCIILQLQHTGKAIATTGMKVDDGKRSFVISSDREVSAECFSFTTSDEEYEILKKLKEKENNHYLKDNADFALGIVTGNNKEYISNTRTDSNEMILKGSDICKYHINQTDNYISFDPEKFQQVAQPKYYRAKEKLLYRFICNRLVFAYDDNQTLSLNSCNIVIPQIEELDMKYVLAVLNSRIAQFIFIKEFNSVKILRNHIESIPIPALNSDSQREIIELADKLISFNNVTSDEAKALYDEIDDKISEIFALSEKEKEIIRTVVDSGSSFLV